MMIFTSLLALLFTITGSVTGQADGSFWWLRKETDTPPSDFSTLPTDTRIKVERPCECVKYYLCIDGIINTSGAGLIDIRLGGNVPAPTLDTRTANNQCPDLYDVCCSPPDPITSTPEPTTTTFNSLTLPPDTPCECVSFINCTAERIVSDGKGNTSLESFGIIASHSSCPHVFTVCCALEPTPATTHTPMPSTRAPLHSHCDCVDTYLCDATGTIVTTGAGLLDLRTMYPNPNPDIVCEKRNQICCNIPSTELIGSHTTTVADKSTTISSLLQTAEPTVPANCGSRNHQGIAARILGFTEGESQFGEFPWVAAILRREIMMDKPVYLFVGGATLIHSRIVITAAHKIIGVPANKIWIRLGEWDTQTQFEALPHQNIQVEEIVIHPQFEPRALFNDVAILILKEEVKRDAHINHICLNEDVSEVDISSCVINGWGKDGFEDTGTHQTIMKSLTLPVVANEYCQRQLRTTRLGPYFRLHPSFICAGGEQGIDACTGDGGGPLACPNKDDPTRYQLVGMTAWGIGCGEDGIPGVYVSISANYEWILNQTYGRYPTPTTTIETTTTTTVATPSTITTSSGSEEFYEESEEDYDYKYSSWWKTKEEIRKQRESRRNERRQRKQREKEEKRRQREERRRQREERREERGEGRREGRHRWRDYSYRQG